MSNIYTFSMPFRGTQTVWLEAESDEQAWAMVHQGDWEDSSENSFESEPSASVLVDVQEIEE
jgi:hypothetical protein